MSDCGPGFVLAELVQIGCTFANAGAVSSVGEVGLCSQEQSINHCMEIPG